MTDTRDFLGYGGGAPQVRWPNGAGLALNFVLNVEEGSEYSLGDGDGRSEGALLEVRAPRVPQGDRDLASESMYEYGQRAGFWRIRDLFRDRGLPLTIFACGLALERAPKVAEAVAESGWDICAHGWRWIEHYRLDEATEREHIARAYDSIKRMTGRAPDGWYSRYSRSPRTRRLVVEHGGYSYDSDAYNDDLPYWTAVGETAHLVVPYSLVTNDAKFLSGDVFNPQDYADFLIASFDVLLAEAATRPRIMSVGIHSRILGHPGRLSGLMRFIDHVQKAEGVWIAGRADIARHWAEVSPA
ncbi:Peptidoglycan/xylan/chitin deacetylase, PgdA/CDA1 family [Pseudooceanicola antarcticus]|uniref:Chitooligosaccharide deacetylase n=1 Tax=Pseudooceanicola antarcticus TaxID=1247613 RepID=A0A285HLL6_9RHOB|nr:polysaccharide deacetylase family protein [Pseudooceanicola antarcticus]PJE27971.1 chitin deacetylase [Pseudooceanicola antarcticus]SNY35581.1 Peptidoglycan/xylan/chitin deacetylase, PgdA/CDA1 family [Pseudooceanicola antarcticus]